MNKIFIIEDDEDIRGAYEKLFKMKGFEVESAVNGQQALDTLSEKGPHELPNCILVDLMMPVMTGQEFLKEIEKHHTLLRRVPIIITTALNEQETPHAFADNVKILFKPIRIKDLLEEVSKSMGGDNSASL